MTETGNISQSGTHVPPSDTGIHTLDCVAIPSSKQVNGDS